jgi:hypothetical protein
MDDKDMMSMEFRVIPATEQNVFNIQFTVEADDEGTPIRVGVITDAVPNDMHRDQIIDELVSMTNSLSAYLTNAKSALDNGEALNYHETIFPKQKD